MFAKIRAFLVSFWNAAAESMITKGMGDWNVGTDPNAEIDTLPKD